MKLIMAVSADGYVARDEWDDMRWTGRDDKTVFKLLTMTGPRLLGCGKTTFEGMPKLKGRELVCLSRGLGYTRLDRFARAYPGAWLIGGQKVAMAALSEGLVGEAHLCRSSAVLGGGIKDVITPFLADSPDWSLSGDMRFGDVTVEHWHRERPR